MATKEWILNVGSVKLLMPLEQALQAFQLLHGSTAVTTRYDASYNNIGWKVDTNTTITMEHADPTLRAKIALGDE